MPVMHVCDFQTRKGWDGRRGGEEGVRDRY